MASPDDLVFGEKPEGPEEVIRILRALAPSDKGYKPSNAAPD